MPPQSESPLKNKPAWQRTYSIAFLAVVFSLLIMQVFVPEITLDTISEKYLWRKNLVGAYRRAKYGIGDRIFGNAIVGKDGWLYYIGDLTLRDYQKNKPLSAKYIERLMDALTQINETVFRQGGTFLAVVPPDKSTVYPQYMPDEIPVIGTVTSLDRLVERVGESGDVRLLDLRTSLLEAGRETQTYYKTDTHWNCRGAFYAYKEIILDIADELPEISGYTLDDFKILSRESNLDIAKMMDVNIAEGMMRVIPNLDVTVSADPGYMEAYDYTTLRVVSNSDKSLPTLMIFHDSFYEVCLNVYLEPSFGRTISIPYRDIDLADMLSMIEREQPDIVIFEFVERFMESLVQHFDE